MKNNNSTGVTFTRNKPKFLEIKINTIQGNTLFRFLHQRFRKICDEVYIHHHHLTNMAHLKKLFILFMTLRLQIASFFQINLIIPEWLLACSVFKGLIKYTRLLF